MKPTLITWTEPNRAKTNPLHIADRGARFSTLTGVTWLDDKRYLVAHRSGLRAALFDTAKNNKPIQIFELPHLVDDIASWKINKNTWEVTVSGCWDSIKSTFNLNLEEVPTLKIKSTTAHKDRTFSHGVRYDKSGNLCIALHTGVDPRIIIGKYLGRLPKPWGARCVCYFDQTETYFAVAVSTNPKMEKYEQTITSVWSLDKPYSDWKMKFNINGTHSDACEVYKNRIWLPDQKLDRVIGVCIQNKFKPIVLRGKFFDFPHGLSISPKGTLAVTNYGNSSVVLLNLNEVIEAHTEPH